MNSSIYPQLNSTSTSVWSNTGLITCTVAYGYKIYNKRLLLMQHTMHDFALMFTGMGLTSAP